MASGLDLSQKGSSPLYSTNKSKMICPSSSKRSCASGKNDALSSPLSL